MFGRSVAVVLLSAICLCTVRAQSGLPPTLPAVLLTDAAGLAVRLDNLRWVGRSCVVVIDANIASAHSTLFALSGKQGVALDRLTIIAIGTAARIADLKRAHPPLAEARWLRADDASVLGQLRAAGVPTLFGVDAEGRVVWQRAGSPSSPDLLRALVSGWQREDEAKR